MNPEDFKELQKDIIETSIALIEVKKTNPQISDRLTWFVKGLNASSASPSELAKWFSDITN